MNRYINIKVTIVGLGYKKTLLYNLNGLVVRFPNDFNKTHMAL